MDKHNSYMIIVPHPDDEINIAGALIYELKLMNKKVKVVFVTNGDNFLFEGKIRLKESIKALEVLGVESDDIIFLGYPDGWKNKHIYNCEENEIAKSLNTRVHTCALENKEDFSYIKRGYHNSFTKKNMMNDISEVIEEYLPEVIIVNDYDNHPDHKAVSLIFDEVMGKILKTKDDYNPIILKKFAYNGVWKGKNDYYSRPICETVNNYKNDELEVPYFKWKDRISYNVLEQAITPLLKDNIVYKALSKYNIELAFIKANCICSKDIVYWQRRSDNLCLKANISVSSGDKKYINDFKYIDCDDLLRDDYNFSKYIWSPQDKLKMIEIELYKKSYIAQISLYENSSIKDNILNVHIVFDNCICFDTGELMHDGSESRIIFNQKIHAKNIRIYIDKFKGENCGLSEIEIYENEYERSNQLIKFPQRSYSIEERCIIFENFEKIKIFIKYFVLKLVRKLFRTILKEDN